MRSEAILGHDPPTTDRDAVKTGTRGVTGFGGLRLVEEWRALGVRVTPALPLELLAGPGGHGHGDRCDEEHSHDDECEDPLQGNHLAEELRNANRRGEDAEVEAHGIVLDLLAPSEQKSALSRTL